MKTSIISFDLHINSFELDDKVLIIYLALFVSIPRCQGQGRGVVKSLINKTGLLSDLKVHGAELGQCFSDSRENIALLISNSTFISMSCIANTTNLNSTSRKGRRSQGHGDGENQFHSCPFRFSLLSMFQSSLWSQSIMIPLDLFCAMWNWHLTITLRHFFSFQHEDENSNSTGSLNGKYKNQ